ncbi:MAG: helix-turn-helix transcriptional regulator [Bacteroidetes bacterium]|nr:helix-turn-helix transcriptional regulator [Bacteroidota bacterium]
MIEKEKQVEFYGRVGFLIKNARKKLGHKQEYVANRLGLTRTSYVNIEAGQQKIHLHTLLELSSFFEMDIKEFLPDIDGYTNILLNKSAENKLSKAINRVVEDNENVSEILRRFIKYTENKK